MKFFNNHLVSASRILAIIRALDHERTRAIRTRPDQAIVKACSCGRTYTMKQWRRLQFHAIARLSRDYMYLPDLEMRHCKCGSTISIEYYDSN